MRLTKVVTKRFDVPNDPDNGWVEIEHIKPNVVDEIVSNTTETALVDGQQKLSVDGFSQKNALAKTCLKDWGNMFDESGRPLKFTPGNVSKSAEFILRVDGKDTGFYAWLNFCREELAIEVAKEREEAAKN